MSDDPMQRPGDEELSAWLDNELPPARAAAVQAWLQAHAEDAARVRLWAADRDALRARLDPLLDEPVPERLRHTVRSGGRGATGRGRLAAAWAAAASAAGAPWRVAVLALGLVATGAAGGGALVWLFPPAQQALQVRLNDRGGWAHRAAVAHAVYAPEVRHPVEVNVAQGDAAAQRAQEEHLTRWLSKRLEMPVPLFDLRRHGFELVGGRLLPDAAGPSAQLMYQNASGQRVTIYLRKPEAGVATAFNWRREGELGMFYWVDEGFGCALVGKLPRESLLAMAEAVYRQAEAAADAAGHPAPGPAANPGVPAPPRPAPVGG